MEVSFDTVEELDKWYKRQRAYMLSQTVQRISGHTPWGYKRDEDDPTKLVPIPSMLESLAKARDFLQVSSYRKVAEWLSFTTGVPITHMGLKKIVESRAIPEDQIVNGEETKE